MSKRIPVYYNLKTTRRVSGRDESIIYHVEIDPDALHRMAIRAAGSKGRQCTDGPVRVILTSDTVPYVPTVDRSAQAGSNTDSEGKGNGLPMIL